MKWSLVPINPLPARRSPAPNFGEGLALQLDEGLALQLDEGLAYNAFLVLRKEDASSPQGADV